MRALVDDAGLFPPTALDMPDAVARHRADLGAASPVLTHRFLCPVSRITELREALAGTDHFDVGLIADSGADGLADAVAQVAADERLALAGVEFPLARTGHGDPGAALGAALTAVSEAGVADEVPLFVEPVSWNDVPILVEAIAAGAQGRPVGVKLRCGGVRAELFPSPEQLALALVAAARTGVMVKATAGLHHAVRHTDASTGFVHHGYVNVLVATVDAVLGADADVVARTLRMDDASQLIRRVKDVDDEAAERARAILVSYGSCSTSTPLAEARNLTLLSHDHEH
ncbi:hypothetical protein [Phytoactinopolyspora halophila]|nr:hypothetical protein [Phytoactinopolyspora halophila]